MAPAPRSWKRGPPPADIEEFAVPGAFELPQAARCAAETGRFDAIICLGCVIRGATPHFEYISSAVAHGIMAAAGETGLPIAFGVLTTDTQAQAEERAGKGPDNKGWEAAAACIEMAVLFRKLGRAPARPHSRSFGFEPGPGAATLDERVQGSPRGEALKVSMTSDLAPGGARERPRCACCTRRRSAVPARTRRLRPIGRRTTAHGEVPEPLREFANSLVRGTLDRVKEIDAILTAHAQNWRIERMAVIDRLVLRLAVFELLAEPNTPPRVVINEALELARSYSGEEAVAFVNGVLDAVRKELKRE